MRFLIGCILGLAALTPLVVVAARAVAVPTPPTNLVVASADARDCTPYNGPFGYYGIRGAGPEGIATSPRPGRRRTCGARPTSASRRSSADRPSAPEPAPLRPSACLEWTAEAFARFSRRVRLIGPG